MVHTWLIFQLLRTMAPVIASGNPAPRRTNTGNEGRAPDGEERGYVFNQVILRNRLTALVVDGDRFCRTLEHGLLHAYGVETQAVDNGRAAVELIASGKKFNLIVIDMLLPLLNGFEVRINYQTLLCICLRQVSLIPVISIINLN